MKKIKILHVIGSLRIGGAENVAVNFFKYIDKKKFICDYLVFDQEEGEYEKDVLRLGGNVIRIPSPKQGYIKYLKNLENIMIKNKYEVVHSHILLANGFTLRAAHKAGIPIRKSHSHSTKSGKKEGIFYKMYIKYMKVLINIYSTNKLACGRDAGIYLYGKKIFLKECLVINNGIFIEDYKYSEEKSEEIKNKLGIKNKFVIGHTGRFASVKNHSFLIDIFYEIVKLEEESVLLLVGDGELKSEIEKKINSLELSKKVKLLGNRGDVADLLQAMDVFVFPSFFEGLPLSLIEAQAAGIPSFVSDRVTNEVKIINNLNLISLDKEASEWARYIIENKSKKIDTTLKMEKSGFDILYSIRMLEKIYG